MPLDYEWRGDIVKHSAIIVNGEKFEAMLRKMAGLGPSDPILVETGTHKGLSAALAAKYFAAVHTWDLRPRDVARTVWTKECVADRVIQHEGQVCVGALPERFDAAFIDSEHTFEGCRRDFDVVHVCGLVLFHDYDPKFTGVIRFVEGIVDVYGGAVYRDPPFALWFGDEREWD